MKTLLKMLRHKAIINKNFELFIGKVKERQAMHDASKFQQDEFDGFAELDSEEVFKLYGTEEYKKRIADNKGIELHYKRNSHHPEFYLGKHKLEEELIDAMSFTDILEMVIDWKSASETYGTDFEKSLSISKERFLPSPYTWHMIQLIAHDLYGTPKPALK